MTSFLCGHLAPAWQPSVHHTHPREVARHEWHEDCALHAKLEFLGLSGHTRAIVFLPALQEVEE